MTTRAVPIESSKSLKTSLVPQLSQLSPPKLPFNLRFRSLLTAIGINSTEGGASYGTERTIDKRIRDLIRENTLSCSTGKKLNILEVGAGSLWYSYGKHFGAPHLSHQLKVDFPSARVTVSDCHDNNDFALFGRSISGELAAVKIRSKYGIPAISAFVCAHGQERILPIAPEALRTAGCFERYRVAWALAALDIAGWDGKELYLRPMLDAELEQNLFGVDTVQGLNYLKSRPEKFDKKFDVIFARHLVGMHRSLRGTITRTLQEYLENGGSAIIEIDGAPPLCFGKHDTPPHDSTLSAWFYRRSQDMFSLGKGLR